MAEVIAHDFGKERTESARRMARLIGLIEQREADILADPVKFFNLASDKICQLREGIDNARNALRQPFCWEISEAEALRPCAKTIVVDEAEFNRLRACADLVLRLSCRF